MDDGVTLPLYLSWKTLKQMLGWPYGRTHTGRLMYDDEYEDRRFPEPGKIGKHRSSHPMWYTPDVLAYFKRHGLRVPENVKFS